MTNRNVKLVRYIQDCDEDIQDLLLDFVKHLEEWGYNTPPLKYVTDALKKTEKEPEEKWVRGIEGKRSDKLTQGGSTPQVTAVVCYGRITHQQKRKLSDLNSAP